MRSRSANTPAAVTSAPAPGPWMTSGRWAYRLVVKAIMLSFALRAANGCDWSNCFNSTLTLATPSMTWMLPTNRRTWCASCARLCKWFILSSYSGYLFMNSSTGTDSSSGGTKLFTVTSSSDTLKPHSRAKIITCHALVREKQAVMCLLCARHRGQRGHHVDQVRCSPLTWHPQRWCWTVVDSFHR